MIYTFSTIEVGVGPQYHPNKVVQALYDKKLIEI